MTDDLLITLQHEGYLLMDLMVSVCTAIKTGNPLLFKERCQIRSELLQIIRIQMFDDVLGSHGFIQMVLT